MTFLEKAKKLRPELTKNEILGGCCPFAINLEPKMHCLVDVEISCLNCWNREMPEVNQDVD